MRPIKGRDTVIAANLFPRVAPTTPLEPPLVTCPLHLGKPPNYPHMGPMLLKMVKFAGFKEIFSKQLSFSPAVAMVFFCRLKILF